MKRRKVLAGLGSFTAAGVGLMSTGAFTSVSANRDVAVEMADDADALLAMAPAGGPNGAYASETGGTIFLDLSETADGGSGVGTDSLYQFDDVFEVSNQGTQPVYVWASVDFSGVDFDAGDIYFYPNGDEDEKLRDSTDEVLGLGVGQSATIGVYVDTHAVSSGGTLPVTIHANADKPDPSAAVDGSGEDFAVVTQNPTESNEYGTIQDAVDNVSGSTVVVESGTYSGRLDVDGRDGLTIRGADGAVFKPDSTLDWGSVTNFPNRSTSIRVVNSRNFTMEGLTVDFDSVAESVQTGMLVWESTVELRGNVFRDMSTAGPVDITSYFGTDDPGTSAFTATDRATVEVLDNEFIETGRIGVNLDDYVHGVVEDNTFQTTDAGYAIEVGSESTGELRRNVIEGYDVNFGSGAESAGVYIENAYPATSAAGLVKDVVVTDNEITGSHHGVRVGNEWGTIAGDVDIEVTLTDNTISGNTIAGVSITDSGDDGGAVAVSGSGNVLEDNEIGYYVYEENSNSAEDDGSIAVDVTGEAIRSNGTGVLVESTSDAPVDSFQSVSVTGSNVVSNDDYGVKNDVGNLTVDATNNWWGDSSGPSGAGNGGGDEASQNVDFDPYAGSEQSL